jgi:hypothetical protein
MQSNEDIISDARSRAQTDTEVVDFENCLRGLVKLQARVRGMLARKRVDAMLAAQRNASGYENRMKR